MKRASGAWLSGGFLICCLSACGSSTGGGSGNSAQACADVARARCTERSSCSALSAAAAAGFSLERVYGDMTTCLAREALACQNGLAARDSGNSPDRVERCVAEFATYSCQDFFDNNPPADCAATGSRVNDAVCTFNGQCVSGYCQGTKNSVCGVCAAPPLPGDDCGDSTCWHNQRCVSADMTCEAVVSLNQSCDGTHPCDNGLACVGNTAALPGSCQAAGTRVGVACGGGTMPGCDGTLGLFCGGATGAKTCMAIELVHGGQPCGALPDGTRAECVAGDCYSDSGLAGSGDTGTCQDAVDAPSACDTALGPGCLPPARCVTSDSGGTTGTCVVPVETMCS